MIWDIICNISCFLKELNCKSITKLCYCFKATRKNASAALQYRCEINFLFKRSWYYFLPIVKANLCPLLLKRTAYRGSSTIVLNDCTNKKYHLWFLKKEWLADPWQTGSLEGCQQCFFLLTLLLSYSFLEAANSWALDMAIPQNGRYICITWGQREC